MQRTFEPARLAGFAILAVAAATTLSVGACSSSKDEKSPAASAPAPAGDKAEVRGLIASVSGNTVQVTQKTGTAPVEVSPSTKVIENTGAQLTDIAAGNCVRVFRAPESAPAPGGAVTAKVVQLTLPVGSGKCFEPKTAADKPVNGTVASVEGGTINVTFIDASGHPAQTVVGVTDTTQYQKDIAATSQAIEQGKCIVARGTKAGDEALHATGVILRSANNKGKCL